MAIAVAVEFLVLHDALALSPWVTDEEREFVKKRVSRIETIPGTPEPEILQNQHRTPPKVQVLRPKAMEKKQS